jgi:hypothetical protein
MKHMHVKQIASLAVIVLGVVLIGYGAYSTRNISSARSEIQKVKQSKNPIVKSASQDLDKKIAQYSSEKNWYFIGGVILVILGGGALVFTRKAK